MQGKLFLSKLPLLYFRTLKRESSIISLSSSSETGTVIKI